MFLLYIFLSCLYIYFYIIKAPSNFPLGTLYTVENGTGLTKTASLLQENEIIRSEFWFKSFLVIFGGPKGLMAGDYALPQKESIIRLAYRFSHGDYELVPIKITFREGLNIFEMADILAEKLPKITRNKFIATAIDSEGYLFPDTYYFLPNSTSKIVIDAMKKNFFDKISELNQQIIESEIPLVDIIKMASIVEKEANSFKTKQTVASILWKRIEIGMPLQVDVSFKYINGKVTKDLSLDDLKTDSPYNSYIYKGLPPTPIANPGLESIRATISPIETNYLYFLSGSNGQMYYAETYKKHLQNKNLYL